MNTFQPRLLFTVFIADTFYDVYDIPGKEHRGYNDMPKTWWLYFSKERLPDGIVPPSDSEHFRPFSKSINRRPWEISIKQQNYTKHKWDETDFRNSTYVEMRCNQQLVYAFTTTGTDRGFAYALAKIQYLQVQLDEHPYNFFEPQTNQGRKVYWYGLPATISVKSDTWEIGIIPDYNCGLSKADWWKELRNREAKLCVSEKEKADDELSGFPSIDYDAVMSDYINWGDALAARYIDWFRK